MKTSSALILFLFVSLATGFISPVSAQTEPMTGTRKVISQVNPGYPNIARSMNLTGAVRLQVVVTPNGSVRSVRVLGGNPVLAQSAESAVHAWKWEKGERETTEVIEIKFTL
jgi:TonB family protein